VLFNINSLNYICFVFAFIILFFLSSNIGKAQSIVIALGNAFYILVTSGVKALFVVSSLVLFVYCIAHLINKYKDRNLIIVARILLYGGVLATLGILLYFKFFIKSFELVRDFLLLHSITISSLIVPIGFSYYTLSLVGYLVDVYHGKHAPEDSFICFFGFATFFPAIIQGPINLYREFGTQIKSIHFPEYNRIVQGLQRSLWGYIKKVVIADRIGIIVNNILTDSEATGFLLLWGMILYGFQIYADFSGGIDVIMGISETLGFNLKENFRFPLLAGSVTEFWKKWHISLGDFMEKYVYYPIVLNHKIVKFSKKIRNKYLQRCMSATIASIVVFVIVGIWHGTGWNYVIYGCYQAFFVSSAILFAPVYKSMKKRIRLNEDCISWKFFTIARTVFLLTIGRYFIKATNITNTFGMLERTFMYPSIKRWNIIIDGTLTGYGLDYKNLVMMYLGIFMLIAIDILHSRKIEIRKLIMSQDVVFRFAVNIAAILFLIVFGIYGPGFDKASYIYESF